MIKGATKDVLKKSKKPVAAKAGPTDDDGLPLTVTLRARVKGKAVIRLLVHNSSYTAEDIAELLNRGNEAWEGGEGARYHRIKKNGRVIAEIEFADEDIQWERYQAE
jgi:hypothetical protein